MPPDILDYPTSADMVVREGSNVNLRCVAKGSPEPSITWRRETGEPLKLPTGEEGDYIYHIIAAVRIFRSFMMNELQFLYTV